MAKQIKTNARNIGIDVPMPNTNECNDKKCPFHGSLAVKQRFLEGKIVSSKMNNSAIIEREIIKYITKFERYFKKVSRITVHNPPCIDAKEGDIVKVALTKPLSKTKTYVVVQVLNAQNKA